MLRRDFLKGMAAAGAASCLPLRFARAQQPDRKFLIVVAAAGGASIIDAAMALRESESTGTVNAFPDGVVEQIGAFRAIDQEFGNVGPIPFAASTRQTDFVRRHQQDMMVATLTGTSVNHVIAQKRSLTGNDAWAGRTLPEAVAAQFGAGLPLPNVNMSVSGYIEPGIDTTIPSWAFAEVVADPRFWFVGLDGVKGVSPNLPDKALVQMARRLRDTKLEPESAFVRTFGKSDALQRYWSQRGESLPALEQADLIRKLNLLTEQPAFPLERFGLTESDDGERLRTIFPNLFEDPLEAQAALAFLLIKYGVSNTVTLGPSFTPIVGRGTISSTPLAFDYSHTSHRSGQAIMWSRIFEVTDKLIALLKEEQFGDGGESFWDRSMVYVATEFGRTKKRPAGASDFGTGHDLNNGVLLISPMVNGGTVLGGVDGQTGLTYGFDPRTGDPAPGRTMSEAEIYGGIAGALGLDTSGAGLPDVPAMRRG